MKKSCCLEHMGGRQYFRFQQDQEPCLLNGGINRGGKMKLIKFLLIACTIGFSTTCDAVTVKGMITCGAWIKSRAEQQAPSSKLVANIAWIHGYLSGVAVARDIDFLKGVDESVIELWMDNYCGSHPSELIGFAADALSVELKKRMNE